MNIKTFTKVFVCILALLGGENSLHAQEDSYYKPPNIHDSSAEGRRAMAIYRMVFRNNPPTPKPGVNDWGKIFSGEEEQLLDSLLDELKRTTQVHIAIVTLDTLCIKTEKFIDISSRIGDKYGVGRKGEKRGMLISFSAGHKMAIIENGFGNERLLTEAQTKLVSEQYILPKLSAGKYYEALMDGLLALAKLLATP